MPNNKTTFQIIKSGTNKYCNLIITRKHLSNVIFKKELHLLKSTQCHNLHGTLLQKHAKYLSTLLLRSL